MVKCVLAGLLLLQLSPIAQGGWCSSERRHRWAVVRYGGATVNTAKSEVPTKKKVVKKKKKKDEALSEKPVAVVSAEAPVEKEEIIVHEVVASVDQKNEEDFGSFLYLSSTTAEKLQWPRSTTVARVHGPRRRWTILRVRVGGGEDSISVEAAENLGVSTFGKLLVVPTKSVPTTTKMVLSAVDEAVSEEDEDVLFDEEITPYFTGSAVLPVKVDDIIATATKKWKIKALDTQQKYALVDPSQTSIVIDYEEIATEDEAASEASRYRYQELGGFEEHAEALREVVELPLHSPEVFARLGIDPPKGALVFGPSGCGKSQLVRAAAYESGAHVEVLAGAEIAARKTGEAEEALRAAFQRAEAQAPAVIVIDDVDLVAKKRDKAANEQEKRLTSQLLTLMDGLRPSTGVVVLAATTKPNELDPAARRFGRLDREIELLVPDEDQRLDILKVKTRGVRLASDVDLRTIAKDCHGFVGADLAQLCTEAALACVKDNLLRAADSALSTLNEDEAEDALLEEASLDAAAATVLRDELEADETDVLTVSADHFARALKTCNPSSLRESVVEVPDVSWADVGGLEEVKRELRETVEYPVQFASLYADFGLPPSKGVLFYGPPGCGKTLIAKAVANECGANFISVKGPELLTMWFGESEANVRNLFDKARAAAPCVLFFDEMDSIAKARSSSASGSDAGDRVMNQILAEIDAVGAKNVFVIGATNRPDILDPAVTRPGRLDQLVHIPLPDLESRKAVFKASLRKAPVDPAVDIDQLAQATTGFSGADIAEICQRAAKNAVKAAVEAPEGTSVDAIARKHFEEAMARARRSVPDSEVARYKKFTDSLKTSAKADVDMKFDFDRGFVSSSPPPSPPSLPSSSSTDSTNPALF